MLWNYIFGYNCFWVFYNQDVGNEEMIYYMVVVTGVKLYRMIWLSLKPKETMSDYTDVYKGIRYFTADGLSV